MKGLISRRINKQHRLVYEIFEKEKLIKGIYFFLFAYNFL